MSDVSFYVPAGRKITRHNVLFPFSFAGAWDVNILFPSSIFVFVHRRLVFGNGFGKFLLVARKLR